MTVRPSTKWWRTFGRPPRIMGLDVARALAVLGMIGAHVGESGDVVPFDVSTWDGLVHGRSSILFAVLAGVSIALMTGRSVSPAPEQMPQLRLRLLGRGAAIFIIGVCLELLNTPIAVILTVYGLLYIAVIPVLGWSVRRLLIACGALAIAGPPVLALLNAVLLFPMAPGIDLALFGTYPITVWLALVLGGMAVGRMHPERIRNAVRILIIGVVLSAVGYGTAAMTTAGADEFDEKVYSSSSASIEFDELPTGVPAEEMDLDDLVCDDLGDGYISCYPMEYHADSSAWTSSDEPLDEALVGDGWSGYPEMLADNDPWDAVLSALIAGSPHSGGTAEVLGSGGFALIIIALCLLLSRPLRWVLLPFAALGSMPLTAYSLHVLSFFVFAGPTGSLLSNGIWGVSAVALLVLATLWARFLGRGPLERLVAWCAEATARRA